jgi:hypothetical protein
MGASVIRGALLLGCKPWGVTYGAELRLWELPSFGELWGLLVSLGLSRSQAKPEALPWGTKCPGRSPEACQGLLCS